MTIKHFFEVYPPKTDVEETMDWTVKFAYVASA